MWGRNIAPENISRHLSFVALAAQICGTKAVALSSTVKFGRFCLFLKLPWWLADKSFVQRSALITGLSFALGGLTLAGIGEWASGRFDTNLAEGGSSASLATSSYNPNRVMISPAPMPELPELSDHMPANSPGYTFRQQVPEVRLQFTVADERGRTVDDLSAQDVRVFDNEARVEHFNEFERDDDLPLQLGLVLDTSDSVRRVLPQERRAAIDFLNRVMRPETDLAFVVAFGGEFKTWQSPTADLQKLVDAVSRVNEPGWGTRVYDALYSACSGQLASPSQGISVHRAIIILSDGDDTDSLHSLRDVIATAQRNEIQIYPLTMHSRSTADRGDRVLQKLADSTGGRLYVAPSDKDLGSAFAQIEQDLRTQYYVSFPPEQPVSGYHSLRIEVNASKKFEVHARQGYYALEQ